MNPNMNVTTEMRDGQEVLVVQPNARLLTTEEQEELEKLSLTVFGASSRWATLLRKGIVEPVMEEVEEYIPAETDKDGNVTRPEETRKVMVPVMYRSPKRGLTTIPLLQKRTFTPETVKTYMLEIKAKQDEFRAMIEKARKEAQEKRKQEAEKAAQLAKADEAAGSVL